MQKCEPKIEEVISTNLDIPRIVRQLISISP